MKMRSTQKEEESEVQMAPLIDCVFILLIFFLVTSMLQKPHRELLFDVPHSGAGQQVAKAQEKELLVIQVTGNDPDSPHPQRTGTQFEPFILIGEEVLTKELLERRLREVAHESPNRRIRIDAGGYLKWRHVVPILDLCRFHGLTRVEVRVP